MVVETVGGKKGRDRRSGMKGQCASWKAEEGKEEHDESSMATGEQHSV